MELLEVRVQLHAQEKVRGGPVPEVLTNFLASSQGSSLEPPEPTPQWSTAYNLCDQTRCGTAFALCSTPGDPQIQATDETPQKEDEGAQSPLWCLFHKGQNYGHPPEKGSGRA